MGRTLWAAMAVMLAAIGLTAVARGSDGEDTLGKVHFSTSCMPAAQALFDRAMLYQHSFWYSAARRSFEEVLQADPECTIAYWGLAQSALANPFNPTPPKNLADGSLALQKAKALPAKTQRENDFIAAISAFYADHDKVDQRTRAQAYLAAMQQLAQRYPEDDEAQIYYALALDIAASPSDKTYANQLKAAALLEPIFKRQPRHPGVAHYLIHTYDYPPIAQKVWMRRSALPRSPRMRRMPSTCRRISLPGWATGRSRSFRITRRRASRGRTTRPTINCTHPTTWSTPTCKWGRIKKLVRYATR